MQQNYLYSDFGLLFKKHPTTQDMILKYDVDSVKQALQILFLTNNYEKRFDPKFGVGIYHMLFDNITPLTKITLLKKIQNQLAYYEPRVVIDDLQINVDKGDNNEITVDFYFHVVGQLKTELLTLNFARIR